MPVVRWKGSIPGSVAEGSGPADWLANLQLAGDLSRLAAIEVVGPFAAFFSAEWNAPLAIATVAPEAVLDFEAFSAAGELAEVELALEFVFDDGSRQTDGPRFRVDVLDRDDTAPTGLAFTHGSATVRAGEGGAVIGALSVTDPDSAGPFFFSFSWEDEWRFEVVDGVLKLRDGIWLGLDDTPMRPILVNVSDGAQSAAFLLEVRVEPDGGPAPYAPPPLALGEDRQGFALAGPREAITARPAADATAVMPASVAPAPGGPPLQVLLDSGESVLIGPEVDRIRFSDGWLEVGADGPAARAAALRRAVLGEDADGVALAPLVARLREGAAWVEVAEHLLASAPALSAAGDAAFVNTLAEAALGTAPGVDLLSLHAGRLAGGAATRAQVAVDIALSPKSLERLAAEAPSGRWVAEAFDDASDAPARPAFDEPTPALAAHAGAAVAWFM